MNRGLRAPRRRKNSIAGSADDADTDSNQQHFWSRRVSTLRSIPRCRQSAWRSENAYGKKKDIVDTADADKDSRRCKNRTTDVSRTSSIFGSGARLNHGLRACVAAVVRQRPWSEVFLKSVSKWMGRAAVF